MFADIFEQSIRAEDFALHAFSHGTKQSTQYPMPFSISYTIFEMMFTE